MRTKLHFSNSTQKSFIVFTLFIFSLSVFSQNEFITTWKTDNTGSSNDTSITIPTTGEGYNYEVDWTYDGITFNVESTGVTGNIIHDYSDAGTYTVAIRGIFPRIYFNSQFDRLKIMSIEQWGTNPWTSMQAAFFSCGFLVSNATDAPNLSGVTDASDMFWNANSFNADLTNWDVSNVTDMSYMFGVTAVTGDLSNWDVSNVTNMYAMFSSTTVFNGDLSTWDVSNVVDMASMFEYAEVFNGDINSWDVSKVEDMGGMFSETTVFNGDLSNWVLNNVTDMESMFLAAEVFNRDLSSWDVSNVEDMGGMFLGAEAFNGNISTWDVSNVNNMESMFLGAEAFNGDIGGWDVSNVGSMTNMFSGAIAFDRDLGNWDISSVSDMQDMFIGATLSTTNYDNTLIGWNTLSGVETQIPTNIFFFNGGYSTYCNGEAARLSLTNDYTWINIIDGGLDCSGLSINDNEFFSSIRIFPNPSHDEFSIKGRLFENSVLEIYNLNGQLVQSRDKYRGRRIDISGLSSSVYFVKISNGHGAITKRLIIE